MGKEKLGTKKIAIWENVPELPNAKKKQKILIGPTLSLMQSNNSLVIIFKMAGLLTTSTLMQLLYQTVQKMKLKNKFCFTKKLLQMTLKIFLFIKRLKRIKLLKNRTLL